MVGKKKTRDIQFYREALESVVDETSGRRTKMRFGDEDEIAQEQEERRRRSEANDEFRNFAEKVVEASRGTLEVDVPFRDLGFSGVPSRQNVLLQPTTDCLVHLVEPPFLTVTLTEVEVAFLERVVFGLKNFDLVMVMKDHNIPPVHVNSIPMTQLEAVKEWLDSVDVYFVESKVNFNWANIMKTVNEDPSGFYEMGGWTYLQPDEVAGASDDDVNSSEFEPEDEEVESESEEDEEEYEETESDEEATEEETEDEDENEEAPDWDELEEEARMDDERREGSRKRVAPPPRGNSRSTKRR
jgi:nucleosome binding factor SPN SPT16 subunit